MRLQGKVAVVVGGGQSPGATVGTGRAISIVFARQGAQVVVANRSLPSAQETAQLANQAAGCTRAWAMRADATREQDMAAVVAEVVALNGRVDVLCYNVGVDLSAGDAGPLEIDAPVFDRVMAANLRGAVMACKHVLPGMRERSAGSIITIFSLAALGKYFGVGYKASKAALIAYTKQLAAQNAIFGVRANAILPGTLATPMAVEARVRAWGWTRDEVMAERDARVPTRRQGTGWDVGYAACFLASDEAGFITGAEIPVDGGYCA